MGMYQGVNASEGIGIGTVMVAVDPDLTFEPHEVADSAAEKERYQSALSVFCEKTQAQADHMKETVGEAEAEIMSGHIVLAQDPGMTDAINAAIDGGTCAEQALMDTSTMFENMFLSMDDEMFRLCAADIADIRTGILAELLGKTTASASTPFSADFIVGTKHSNFFQKLGNKGMRCMLFRHEMQGKTNFAKK